MKMPEGWYAFVSPSELNLNRPTALRRMGMNWVVWRKSNGQWIAQKDQCPHRSARLSLGWVEGDCIRCPFHGFSFNDEGQCTYVPEIDRAAPGLKVETYHLIEKTDFLWIPWRNPQQKSPSWFDELDHSEFTYCQSRHRWANHFSRCVESQLDYVHLPFVHKNSIGKGFDPQRQVVWKLSPEALRVDLGPEGSGKGFFEFRFANVWRLVISEKMVQTLMFVPVDENETLIYARAYHKFTRIPILRQLIAWVSARIANPYILAQDQRVVLSQLAGDVREAEKDEMLLPSDRAIQAFRRWLNEK
jgi:renierapurpurin 18,18'-hydroxylase